MIMNCGMNKTFGDVTERVVEVHLMHDYGRDFYGRLLKVVVLGFLRNEMRFNGVEQLKEAIANDIQVAKDALDLPQAKSNCDNKFLVDG